VVGSRRRDLVVLDGLTALGLAVLPQVAPLRPQAGTGGGLGWALCVATAAPLAVRRLWPRTVLAAVLTATGAALLAGLGPAVFLAAAYALYPVATRPPAGRLPAVRLGGACVAGAALLAVTGGQHGDGGGVGRLLFGLLLLGATWAAGTAVRERRESLRRVVEEAAARARVEERLRIAREVHDVVAHGVGLIAVKAGIANHLAADRPEEGREALRVIEEVSRDALRDLRGLLAVLRDDAVDVGLRPAPGLGDLPALVRTAQDAGVQVDLHVDLRGVGADRIPDGVALSAFRIVQEGLTNVVRHAGPTRCSVQVVGGTGTLRVEVTDEGPAPGRPASTAGAGLGLVGMDERVRGHGGTFGAGPHSGGFRVLATLPYRPAAARTPDRRSPPSG